MRLVILSIICLATKEKEKYTIAREDDLSEGERNESPHFWSVHIWKGFFIASVFCGRRVHYMQMICGVSWALWKCGRRAKGPKGKREPGLRRALACVQLTRAHAGLRDFSLFFTCVE